MAQSSEDIKWLYGKLKAKGYNIGTEQEFTNSLSNSEDRDWYYQKASAMGLNVGSKDDFESIYAPASAPAPQQTAEQPQATEQTTTPEATPTTETASAPATPAWQPTEQEKIAMSYQLHQTMQGFNDRTKEMLDQTRRMSEHFTPEGRERLKAAEFQARLAGTPTKVMGLTPPTPAPASAEGEQTEGEQTAPVRSMQSPVPYGVKIVDGKRVTEWLLPDGRLTTNLREADQAEYVARGARLQHQFVNRMKQNGLDPSKPEDVQQQAQMDMQAPIYEHVAELWDEAEKKHREDVERSAKKYWDSYSAMGGGREMRIVTSAMDRYDRDKSHLTRFDIQTMMDDTWSRLGDAGQDQLISRCYETLSRQNPEADPIALHTSATQMARSLSDNAVYQYAVAKNTPKSTLEYFGRQVADMNLIRSISKGLARSGANGKIGDLPAYEAAMGEYGKNHRFAQIAGTVTGMAIDPTTWISGGVGSMAGKGALNIGGRIVASRAANGMTRQVGSRLFASSLGGRVAIGAAGGAGNFATYEMMKEGERQFMYGGVLNPETLEVGDYSAGDVLKAGGHGVVMGAATGTISPLIGNVSDKVVKATSSTAGKAGVRLGEVAVSTVAEGTVFSIPEWISGEGDAFDVWTDNLAMMAGFKAQHGLKSAPRVIAGLRPIAEPKTQAERNHNRQSFVERLRKNMDASSSDLAFTKEEREELRRAGYGELADLFRKDKPIREAEPKAKPEDGAIELRGERIEAEEGRIKYGPERVVEEPVYESNGNQIGVERKVVRDENFEISDGYSAMERLMQDGSVSQAARAKAYYILTGRMLPMGSITGWNTTTDNEGNIIVNSMTAQGEVVTSRTFKNQREADAETGRIQRQAELNTIDIGEQFREAEANALVFEAAVNAMSPGADHATIREIYEKVKRGDKDVTEDQRALVEFLDEAIDRNMDAGKANRPDNIRSEIKEQTGIDVDDAIRKQPGDRSKEEQDAVQTYMERLYPEEARRTAEPTPEQQEAQQIYDDGRLLYGRFDEGNPEEQAQARADMDAISLRYKEALELVDDAFGAEAEMRLAEMQENPWDLVTNPELTADQQDAVLYYINAKAALDGVQDAANESADRKRDAVVQAVEARTHVDAGVVIPATMKVDDREVFIVKGNVVMFEDGTAVDVRNSDNSVVVFDPANGEREFTSPDRIFKVGEAVDPQAEIDNALAEVEAQRNVFPEVEDKNIPTNGNNEDENIPVADVEAYDRGYEEGLEVAKEIDDATLNQAVSDLRERYKDGTLSDEWRGRLEAYEYEQQNRAGQAVSSQSEAVEPITTENAQSEGEIVPKTEESVENGQQSALQRIPLHPETQEPMFESVDKDTAWDGLVEAVGSEKDALEIGMAQIQQASADLEALKKKPPTPKTPKLKGSPMAMAQAKREANEAHQRAMTEYGQQLAEAEAREKAWNAIVGVYTSRNAELRRQQDEEMQRRQAEEHDAAVARFEEEQRIKAEKQAEQEAVGIHAVNPKLIDRWQQAKKVEGKEDVYIMPDGTRLKGRYMLVEAGTVVPSHNPFNAYAKTEGFPIDENGNTVNDRDYESDKNAQSRVQGMADRYDARAIQDAIIVSSDGIVLSGNNRTMSGEIAARANTDKDYIDYLRDIDGTFSKEQLAEFEHPRKVFVLDEQMPYTTATFARFNKSPQKTQNTAEATIKHGKTISDDSFNRIVRVVAEKENLADFFRDDQSVAMTIGLLRNDGALLDDEIEQYFSNGRLTDIGRIYLESVLVGKSLDGDPDAVRKTLEMPTIRTRIASALMQIADNRTLGNGYDLRDELSRAIDLVYRAKSSDKTGIYSEGRLISPFGAQAGLFDDEFGASNVTDGTVLMLADLLNHTRATELRKILEVYNKTAREASNGVADIFTGTPDSKEDILKLHLNHFNELTKQQREREVADAVAARQAAAAAERTEGSGTDKQVATADGRRGAGAEQPELTKANQEPEKSYPTIASVNDYIKYKNDVYNEEVGKLPDWLRPAAVNSDYAEYPEIGAISDEEYQRYLTEAGKKPLLTMMDVAPQLKKRIPLTAEQHKMLRESERINAVRAAKSFIKRAMSRRKAEDEQEYDNQGNPIDEWGDLIVEQVESVDAITDKDFTEPYRTVGLPPLPEKIANAIGIGSRGPIIKKNVFEKNLKHYKEFTPEDGRIILNQTLYNPQLYGQNLKTQRPYNWILVHLADKNSAVVVEVNNPDKENSEIVNWHYIGGEELERKKRQAVKEGGLILTLSEDNAAADTHDDLVSDGKDNTLSSDKQALEGGSSARRLNTEDWRSGLPDDGRYFFVHVRMSGENRFSKMTPDGMTTTRDVNAMRLTKKGLMDMDFDRFVSGFKDGVDVEIRDYQGKRYFSTIGTRPDAVHGRNESSVGYTISPATYINKKGRKTPVSLLTIGRELSKDEEAAIKKFASEKLSEGRFAKSRGWKDRESGGWMFRSEEDARKAAEMVGNDEAVADNQPLSREDIREAADVTVAKAPGGNKKMKSAINRVSIEDVAESLRTKGETKLSDHATPVEPIKPSEGKRSLEITDAMKADEDILRDLLGIDDDEVGDVHFRDTDGLTPEQKRKVYAVGVNYSLGYFDQGVVSFPDFAKAMVGRLGEKIKPWLKSFYEGAKRIPGYDESMFTPTEEVDRFDVANFDKPSADVMKQAEMIVAERKAREATSQAEKEITETRNQKRKENDKQTEADTAALGEKAEAVASKAESLCRTGKAAGRSVAETSADRGELNRAAEEIDDTLAEVNDQLAVLGYYEADPGSPEHEVHGLRRSAEKKAVKDATRLATQLIDDLGIDLAQATTTTTTDRKGNKKTKKKPLAASNLTGIDGDITINLPMPDGRNLHINIGLQPTHERGVEAHRGGGAWEGDNLEVDRIMYRFDRFNGKGDDNNHFLNPDVTYAQMLADIQRTAKWGMPKLEKSKTDAERVEEFVKQALNDDEIKDAIGKNDDQLLENAIYDRMSEMLYQSETPDYDLMKAVGDNLGKLAYRVMQEAKKQSSADFVREMAEDNEGDREVVAEAPGETKKEGIGDIFDKADEVAANAKAKREAKKSAKKSVSSPKQPEVKPEQPIGDLFSGLFDETNDNERQGDTNRGSQAVADGERTHTVGADGPRTDGGLRAGETRQNGGRGDSDAVRSEKERGTDGATPATGELGSVQPSERNRGRDAQPTDGGVSVPTGRVGRDGADRPRTERRGANAGAESVSEGATAPGTGKGGRPASVKKQERRFTKNFRYGEDGNEADNYTPSQRLEGNVAALETLADVLFGNGKPTEEQKAVMSRFRGWGQIDLAKYWNVDALIERSPYGSPLKRLAAVIKRLDPDGEKKLYEAIKRASLSAYFTPTPVARAQNTFLTLAGFRGGKLLDPSMGNGVFEGTMPKELQERTMITGVELDWLTGQLARVLYPDADVRITGFQNSGFVPNSFDVITSNVPFGDFGVNDPSWKNDKSPIKRSSQNRIHNYYAVKMLELTRPGGLVSMMTTSAVMDTPSNQNVRRHIAEQGEIIGAVRIPDNTFQGTGAVADIIFVRKWRDENDMAETRSNPDYQKIEAAFLGTSELTVQGKDGNKVKVNTNGYYGLFPKNMIGDAVAGNQYRADAFGLTSKMTYDEIGKEIEKAVKRIVGTRKGELFNPTKTTREVHEAVREAYKGDGDWVSNGNLVVQDGKTGTLQTSTNEYGEVTRTFIESPQHSKLKEKIADMGEVRKAMKMLVAAQINGADEKNIAVLRKQLNTAYNNFVSKHGKLRDKNNSFILDDIDGYTLRALEVWKDGKFVGLSDIFTKNTIKPALKLYDAKTPQEAITSSLAEYGELRPAYMEKILGENWAEACGDMIFRDPDSEDGYVTRDEYLSGDVVSKLEKAEEAAKSDPTMERNVTALREVQPVPIPFSEISTRLGARWIPGEVYSDFVRETYGLHVSSSRRRRWVDGKMVEDMKSGISYSPDTDTFHIEFDAKELGGEAEEWSTARKSAKEILQAALEDKTIVVYDTDKEGNKTLNSEQTELANEKVSALRERFETWLGENEERAEMLAALYNRMFNSTVKRKFDGSHLNIPGLMGKELRPHQKDAVWMLINNRGGIVDHIVGAGKTLVMQSAIMEMRRMGIAKKPMIVALKSTVPQIAREFKEAFPSARVLAPSDGDFSKENRKRFMANISLNDYDCVILSHEQYCMLPHSEEAERVVIDEQLAQLNAMIEYLYGTDDKSQMTKKQIKALEKRKENLLAKLAKRLDRNVDREFCFENLGVDYLFVDECHQFKSLPYVTSYNKVAGLGDAQGSNRAVALLTGIRYLQKMHQGDKGTIFLSGTTITNSLVEIYNLMNYLRPRKMEELGFTTFDAWASTFAIHSAELEAGAKGTFEPKDRFRNFANVPELSQLYAEIADVRNDSNLKLPKPSVDGKYDIVPASPAIEEINREIVNMLDNKDGSYFGIHPNDPQKYPWGLTASGLSAKASISPRLIFPDMEDEGGKIHYVCENVKKAYDEMAEHKGVQLIFCELGVPGKGKKYDAYNDIIDRLTNTYGIPRSEIAYIQEAKNDEAKEELFQKAREGRIRILIGGTKNMGTGVNVQTLITDMHFMSVPWTPAALEQCIGRGARQGNWIAEAIMGNKVRVHYYATEGTLDLYKFQLLDAKGKMFTQFKTGTTSGSRDFDEGAADEDGNIDPAELVAILSGNPIIFEKAKQEKYVKKLKNLRNGFLSDYQRKKAKFDELTNRKEKFERLIRINNGDVADLQREGFVPDEKGVYPSKVTVNDGSYFGRGMTFDKPKEAGEYILKLLKDGKKVYLQGFGKRAEIVSVNEEKAGLFAQHYEVQTGEGYNTIRYSVRLSDDATAAGTAFRSLLQRIINNKTVYGNEYENIVNQLNGMNIGDGVFPRQAELDEAVATLKQMTAEYNALGKKESTGDKTKFRVIDESEDELLSFLNSQPMKKGYRYAQWADMGVRPPMTAKVGGEWRPPMLFSRWEQSEEGMRKANGKADLVQGNGRTTGDVAYNPYFHIRTSPLNDQFTAAYDRPELIVVEGYYPESEETSGYRAEGAKDGVGLMDWHSGSVNGQLSDDTKVQTNLSRYFKPSRIVPWSEVADLIMERVGKQKITFPINAVPPMLRAELAKRGARFGDVSGQVAEGDIKMLHELRDRVNAGEHEAGLEKAQAYLDAYESSEEAKVARAEELSQKLHTPIRLITSEEEVAQLPSARHRRAKGWATDKGEIVIVVPNNVNVADIENTAVHEIVGHDGLEAFIEPERMDEFVTEVYDHAGASIRKKIDARADKEMQNDIDRMTRAKGGDVFAKAEATVEANAKKRSGHYQREATKEYIADMAGEIGDKGFEKMSREEQTLWGKIKAKVQKFLDAFLRGLKIAKSIKLTDKDLAYILYKAWKHKRSGIAEAQRGVKNVFAEAEDAVMRRKSGWDKTMFADGGNKKNTARSEAGFNPIYPASNGGQDVKGNEARLNAITDPVANHSAKVMEKLEIAKMGLSQVTALSFKSSLSNPKPHYFIGDNAMTKTKKEPSSKALSTEDKYLIFR